MPLTFAELLDRLHKRKLVTYMKKRKSYYYDIVDSLTKEQIDEIYNKENYHNADYRVDFEITKAFPKYEGWCWSTFKYKSKKDILNHFYGHLDIIEYHNLDKTECIYDLTISLLESMCEEFTLDNVKLLKFLLKQGVDIHKDKGDLTLSPYEYCLTINDPLVTRLFNNYMC